MILYWALRLAHFARWIPLRAAYFLSAAGATLVFWAWPSRRRIAIENLTHVLGDRPAARRAARFAFLNFSRYLVDFLRGPIIRPEHVLSKVTYDKWDQIDAAFRQGNGVIFILMHFGNWDMGGAVLTARGYPLNVIADVWGNDRTNKIIVEAREVRGMKVIPSRNAATGIVRAMRRNEALAILIDLPMAPGEGGVDVKFFGAWTTVPAGPARIALRTGARVIPVALPRRSGTSDEIVAMADLDVRTVRSGDDERDVQALTQRIMNAHERFIRSYPDQWYMFRPMWPNHSLAPAAGPALAPER